MYVSLSLSLSLRYLIHHWLIFACKALSGLFQNLKVVRHFEIIFVSIFFSIFLTSFTLFGSVYCPFYFKRIFVQYKVWCLLALLTENQSIYFVELVFSCWLDVAHKCNFRNPVDPTFLLVFSLSASVSRF